MAKRRRQYGSGSVYQVGKIWHFRWCDGQGRRKSQTSGSERRPVAERMLREKLAEGQVKPSDKDPKHTIDQCFGLLVKEYRMHDRSDLAIAVYRMNDHLAFLKPMPVASFRTADAEDYIADRKAAGAAPATINRELSIVRASLKLAARQEPPWITAVPRIPMLKETNVRIGFLSHAQIAHLSEHLPDYLRPLFCVAVNIGLRRGTLLKIKLDQVDLSDGVITLHGEQVKNRIGHQVPIIGGEMRKWCELAVRENKKFLFERDGKAIRSFKNAWTAAVTGAGMAGLRFHDLRRTGVRNLIRAGVPEEIVMAISGHKTRSMLSRYNIVTVDDVKAAGKKLEAQLASNWQTREKSDGSKSS